ncbi:MAG: adenosylcobinamide-GDP ribazoletransferase [Candidatus Omnitrophota bacterium]|jgi:adenosylcobinamide-GDP ribazoletransferase
MKSFLIALQFLTSIPVKVKGEIADKDLAGSMAYFPLVGLLAGALLALSYNILIPFLPHAAVCAFIMIINVIISGGLHIDGFVDTFDAIASGADRKRMLEIMKEGRPGAVGLASVVLLFIAEYSLLISLPKGAIEGALIAMAVLSRTSFVASSALYPYARDTDGLGKKFSGRLEKRNIAAAFLTAAIAFFLIFGLKTFVFIPAACCVILAFDIYFFRKFGGITGDTMGALGEIMEITALALAVALI